MSGAEDPALQRLQRALARAGRLQLGEGGATAAVRAGETENASLWRYGSTDAAPVLVIYSLVNRPQLLDLTPERSVLQRLAAGGHSVYLLDWNPPGRAHRFVGLSDYVCGDIAEAVDLVSRRHGGRPPDLVGVCQGGVLAFCHAALEPASLRTLTLLATPLDTGTPEDPLARLARDIDFDGLVAATGNVSGPALASVFSALKPFALGIERYTALAGLADADEAELAEFLRMERWMYGGPDQAGLAFAEFARDIYQRNALASGELRLDGRPVGPRSVTCPVYAAYALEDHLVPPAAARAASRLVAGPCREYPQKGGHLGLFISRRAHRELYPDLLEWLAT